MSTQARPDADALAAWVADRPAGATSEDIDAAFGSEAFAPWEPQVLLVTRTDVRSRFDPLWPGGRLLFVARRPGCRASLPDIWNDAMAERHAHLLEPLDDAALTLLAMGAPLDDAALALLPMEASVRGAFEHDGPECSELLAAMAVRALRRRREAPVCGARKPADGQVEQHEDAPGRSSGRARSAAGRALIR